jgi:AhpD family alkylhydroperoxidase
VDRLTIYGDRKSTTAAQFYETWPATMGSLKQRAPDIGRAFGPFFQTLMIDGALNAREKELIALGIAIALRCEPCIYAHVEKCIKAGASSEQVMEPAGVAVMMQGGPAYTYTPIVADALKHLEAAATT